jgi:hypothetical protein
VRPDGRGLVLSPGVAPGAVPRLLLVVVLVMGALVAVPPAGAAAEPQARGIDRVCPERTAQEDPDDPVDIGTTHAHAIRCALGYGLVSGFDDGTFRPDVPITRGQMATFVAAWIRVATGFPLPAGDADRYPDVPGTTHASAIGALSEVGVVAGRADGTFGPDDPLTRGQFTRVMAGAISYSDVFAVDGPLPPAVAETPFLDVPGTTFEATIASLTGVGIAIGTGEGRFAPNVTVTRGQLSTFVMRAADYLDRYQRWLPTALEEVLLRADLVVVTPPAGTDDDAGPEASEDPSEETGDGGASTDEGSDGEDPPTETPEPSGRILLAVDAFGGVLRVTLELDAVDGPFVERAVTLELGDVDDGGESVLTLLTAAQVAGLEAGTTEVEVFEADSALRFADLLEDPGATYVQVATEERPDGLLRGVVRIVEP